MTTNEESDFLSHSLFNEDWGDLQPAVKGLTAIHPEPVNDGWDSFSYSDLLSVLMGDPDRNLTGYYNYSRVINLKNTLNMDVPDSTAPLDIDPTDFLKIFHEKKLAHYKDQRLILFNDESGYQEIPLLTRGMPAYQARVGDVFEDVRDFMVAKNLPCVFLTLSPRTPVGHSPLDSLVDMKAIQNNLMSFLQVRLGYRPKCLWVIEETQRGHCHYHFLFIGMNYLMPREELGWWFKRQGLGDEKGVWLESVSDPVEASKKVVGYLIKYLVKPHSDSRWSGLLGLTKKREWGMSNILRARIEKWKHESKSEPVGEEVGLACSGLTNSNSLPSWISFGILSMLEIEMLLGEKPPPPDELKRDLREIRGALHSWQNGSWHYGEGM